MPLAKRRGEGESATSNMPMNTLIDVVFLLLIYFIITWDPLTPEAHLAVNMPSDAPSQNQPPPTTIELTVLPGQYKFQGNPMNLKKIRAELKPYAEANPEVPIIIKVSKAAVITQVTEVLDVCKSLDLTTLNVMTLKQGG